MPDPPHNLKRLSRGAEFYSAAVYGAIGAAAFVGALREEPVSSGATALTLVSAMCVAWLSHVWAEIVGERIDIGTGFTIRHATVIARAEFPIVAAAFPPTVALALGWADVLSHEAAFDLALVICDIQLVVWGFVSGLHAQVDRRSAVISGLVTGALGIVLVALEIAVLH